MEVKSNPKNVGGGESTGKARRDMKEGRKHPGPNRFTTVVKKTIQGRQRDPKHLGERKIDMKWRI